MGYEVTYEYHERTDDGYNRDETKTMKKKIGDPFEDVPLETLAARVMAQLARRDIWVTNFEVVELSRKKINCKETKGGIILKNKKFLFDENSNVLVQDMTEVPALPAHQPHHQPVQYQQAQQQVSLQGSPIQPHNQGQRRPIDWVVFAPEIPMMPEIKQKNLRFTPDKKYPVFEKQPGLLGEVFRMVDDTGREHLVSDKYFVPGNTTLIGGSMFSEQERDNGNLLWGNSNSEPDMPDIRGRK